MPINNTIGKISVKTADLPQSKFDFSASLHSTLQFGEVVAGYFDFMYPGDKRTVRSSERLLAAPLLAPVFGKAKLKGVHQFVPVRCLTRNFEAMLSQESINRGTTSFVCAGVPNMSLRDLSIFMLWGAKCTVYEGDASLGIDPDDNRLTLYKYSGATGSLLATDPGFTFSSVASINNFTFSQYGLSNASQLRVGRLLDDYPNYSLYRFIPFSNPTNGSFFDVDPSCVFYKSNSLNYDLDTVSLDKSDAVVPLFFTDSSNVDHMVFYAFRFSSFGKRIKKILNVLGYQFNLNSTAQISLLPFLAFYKAYFDLYAPKLYNNWEETYAYKIQQICDLSPAPAVTDFWKGQYGSLSDIQQAIMDFMILEFGATYYTEEQNFWSSHIRNTAVSPSPQNLLLSVNTDVAVTPNISVFSTSPSEPGSITPSSGHASVNDIVHGQLDANLLDRLYRWTNKNTLAGRRISELLRMQGLGRQHECEPDYIGQFEVPLNIYDMLSQSDTYSKATDSGAPLGERAGNGQAQSQEKPFTYEATEYGYWVTLISVVPEGTFTETIAPHVLALKKFDFHTPDFDSLGYEFSQKLLLQGSMPFADFVAADGTLDDAYGLAPRTFKWKFGRSVQTGDFTLRSVRDSVAPYSLEKYVNVGERASVLVSENSSEYSYALHKMFKPKDLPIAGDVWRYVTRYPFIGHFNRIFNYSTGTYERWYRTIGTNQAEYEFFSWMADNFILHVYFDVDNRSKKLPVSRSFETDEDGNVNAATGKA